MNLLKKSLLIALAFSLGIECSNTSKPRKLKTKFNKTRKEVAQIFDTDDQEKIKKEVADVNALAVTPQEKQEVKVALQREIIKETADIKADLIQAQQDTPRYITYNQALDIIKSKKELSQIKKSSWTNSLIIKPFKKTYRLFLRVWNQKEYAELLEKERKTLEHILNVQAHNNIMLLYVALDLKMKQAVAFDIEHMFKKENFYTIATHAFEGGAILSADIELSTKLKKLLDHLNALIMKFFYRISNNSPIIQSIWEMNQVIWGAELLRKDNRIKHGHENDTKHYNAWAVEKLCKKAAEFNKQKLIDNKKTYTQYAKDWISQPKNLAKAGLVMAAIGGLYIYGPAIPAWLKEYANSSLGSISKGYQNTLSSVKNLWNKVRGNQAQELTDPKEARMDAQEQESETDNYFIEKGKAGAAAIQQRKELRALQAEAFFADEFDQQYSEQQHNEGWEQLESKPEISEANIEYENVGRIRLNPTSGQMTENTQITEEDIKREKILEKLENHLDILDLRTTKMEKLLEEATTARTNLKNKEQALLTSLKKSKNYNDLKELENIRADVKRNDESIEIAESTVQKLKSTALRGRSVLVDLKEQNTVSHQLKIDPDLIHAHIDESKLKQRVFTSQINAKKAEIVAAHDQIKEDTENIKQFDQKVADNPFDKFNQDKKELYVYRQKYFQDHKEELEQELETLINKALDQTGTEWENEYNRPSQSF